MRDGECSLGNLWSLRIKAHMDLSTSLCYRVVRIETHANRYILALVHAASRFGWRPNALTLSNEPRRQIRLRGRT